MFADPDLAARIEAAEGALCTSAAVSVRGSAITLIGGGVSVFARPGSPVNKLVGLGFGEPLDEDALARLEDAGPVRAEVSTLADPTIVRLLTARGYRLEGFENVLATPLPAAHRPAPEGVEVSLTDDVLGWSKLTVDGFMHPDETSGHAETFPREIMEEAFADLVHAQGFRRYRATLDGVVAGAGSIFVHGRIALLAGATTLPPHRRRGVQTALLARRLDDAAAAGCEVACITTAPGTRSQANAQRSGFSLLYARAVLIAPTR